ncbi:hypothetical protein BDQ94DRAFT_148081 [Aspergillus welwitschiae]|uniref:Uncharacterized protein n=1 Tax=Aspergillus welwitschiae TaxID=1341132 RepID=A0A3F3PVG4_9EURO|nr:hypothetical protein BDQ94DRAFT_148081 [Aspergillus welwitschiae]RDH30848.1 hypothetical protein BDQ94DRAFT_148081 [Aspergillus welwitschiae]
MDYRNPAALVEAARAGNTDDVWLLLTRSNRIEITEQNSRTPLRLAAANGYDGVVMVHLDRAATTETRYTLGRRPVMQQMGMRLLGEEHRDNRARFRDE